MRTGGSHVRQSVDFGSSKHTVFLKNHWYVAAWDHELDQKLLSRKICNQPLVLYRKKDGRPVALTNRCWHRSAPLSAGRLDNDHVICGYHGLEYNSDGVCTHVPSQETIPKGASVRAYPTVERHSFIWVWMGQFEKADESLVPALVQNNDPGWVGNGGTIHVKCDYRLLIDNLMDLTHETHLHSTSIGHEKLPSAPVTLESDDSSVTLTRWIQDHQPASFWKVLMQGEHNSDANCDRWQIIKFLLPSNVVLDVGVAIAGTGAMQGDRSQGVNCFVLNSFSPETENSCFYFWNLLRTFDLTNSHLTDALHAKNARIFEQDIAMVESQQTSIEESPETKLVSLGIDAGGQRARMILERLMSAENSNPD